MIRPLVVRILVEDIHASMRMFSSYLKTLIFQGGLSVLGHPEILGLLCLPSCPFPPYLLDLQKLLYIRAGRVVLFRLYNL